MNQNVMTIYPAGTTNFDYQGYGTLYDAYSAEVTEASSTNGNITETMEITYPVNGVLSDKIVEGNLVKAQISKTDGDYQIFEIDETEKSDNTVITAYLNAYPYRVLRMSFTNGGKFANFETLTRLLDYAKSYMPDLPTDFKITTNISNPINLAQTQTDPALTPEPTVFKDFSSLLDAILNKVSGQVKFGPRSIEILAHRGQDKSNIELRDDKNTNGISVKIDTTNIVNKIIPLLPVKDKDGNSTSETIVGRIVTPKDPFRFINFYSGQVVNVDTQDLADSYFSRTNCNYPVTTATVTTSMIDEDLSDIRLFDVVSVYSSRINYTAKLKVSERVFDVLAGAVDSFKLGTSSVNVFSTQTAAMNQVEQAVAIGNQALTSANGKNTNYYGDSKPTDGKEGDIWFHTVDGVSQIDQFTGGVWKTIVSDTFGKEVDKKVATAQAEASDAKTKAEEASSNAKTTAAKFDDTDQKAEQALNNSVSAQADASSAVAKAKSTASAFGPVKQSADSALSAALNAQKDASSAVAKAESTASEFGKVSQKTDSAAANALSAQASASEAVTQALSAAADSKDAKQIAGAVSQSYKTLTDGSTMTLAELESGLAAKLTRTDLNGYATQDWSQNQIKLTADGINGTISSVKNTVDSQATSINDLKSDSSSFKSQFTTVNNTLGKQTTDIGSLQATSKELTSGFNTLTSDNTTNKNDISQLKQTATEVSSTLETVQTQVQDSAVGTNLLLKTYDSFSITGNNKTNQSQTIYALSRILELGTTVTLSFDAISTVPTNFIIQNNGAGGGTWMSYFRPGTVDTTKKHYVATIKLDGPSKYGIHLRLDNVPSTTTITFSNMKLELGSHATDYSTNPLDNATVTAVSKLSQTVDSMRLDISKKIEQKDLNGYATETWTRNQIKLTSDGINGTISSIKSTVEGHTTSINDLKADSSGFKAQFSTVNGTLGKQSTDIGTLQDSSKELTTGFNTLTSDNTTNKNNISQLKQTATELISTMTTIQVQVQDSAVGTNLYRATRDIDNPNSVWNHYEYWTKTGEIYNGMTAVSTTNDWNGLSQIWDVKAGETYTFSVYAKYESGTGNSNLYCRGIDNWKSSNTNTWGKAVSLSDTWQRVFVTFNITADGFISPRIERTTNNTNKLIIAGPKLERGAVMTDYSVSPLDNATVSAISNISQTVDSIKTDISKKIEQKDLNGYATKTWSQNQINTTADGINGTISSVKSTVDSHTTSINDLKADSSGFKAQFTTVNNTISKHTTDIGTFQASNKSLSASFDSLSSDNNANKHNISQLQATAGSFSSTLLTVQQQVQNSAVGTNLLLKTGASFSMTGNNTVNQVGSGYSLANGYNVSSLASAFGTQFTISFDWSVSGDSPSGKITPQWNHASWGWYIRLSVTVSSSNASGHVSHTFSESTKNSNTGNMIDFRLDNFLGDLKISNVKLEKGSVATDWCPNPLDNATVTEVSSISQTIDKIQGTIIDKADKSQITQLANQLTSKISGLSSSTSSQITQLKDDISLRVEKAGVINAVNVSSEGIQIYGNKLHITASTYIDNAVIKDAMISNVSANKMTTGTLNAANVNVINLNGRSIVSNSITSNQLASGSVTADKIQSGAIRVSLNHSLQRLEIGVDGMNLMSDAGAIIGRIHSNHMNYDSTFWGLSFDMSANGGDFMAWGAQNNGDVNGLYQTKLAWYRSSTHGYNGGFHFQDRVEFHNPVQFRNSIDTRANYLLGFGSTNVSGYSSVPYLGLSGGATKISFSPGSVWLSRHHSYYNMGAVIEGFSHYLGRAIFIPTGMHNDGRASSWLGINIPSE